MEERINEINNDSSITTTSAFLDPTSPTGAYVTFRYPASDGLTRVAVGCDEMTFANEGNVDIAPEDWTAGSWVHSNVRTSTAREMELVGDYWRLTMPAANGALLYYFYLGGLEDDYIACEITKDFCEGAIKANKQCWDPQNEPLIAPWDTQETFAANQRRSLIYVPRADGFLADDMLDLTLQDPGATDQKGQILFCQIPGEINDEDMLITCSVYLPYGFDAARAEKYPCLVLYHGTDGDYTQWYAHGAADSIFDNLIAQGKLTPTVIIMPNGVIDNEASQGTYDVDFIIDSILPYMQEHYNCSAESADLAMAGLSRGGRTTGVMAGTHTDRFAYYGGFSGFVPNTEDCDFDFDNPALRDIGVLYVSYGDNDNDSVKLSAEELSKHSDIPQGIKIFHGAHQQYVWRQSLSDFAENHLWK